MTKILLIGSTDYTAKAAKFLHSENMLAGVVNTGSSIVNSGGNSLPNFRYVDLLDWCRTYNIYHIHYKTSDDIVTARSETKTDVALLLGVHNMMKPAAIDSFPLGMFAVHASLLPELRGWSPLNWAILLGLKETGISLFKVTPGMDDGPLVCQRRIDISPTDYIGDLLDKAYLQVENILHELISYIKQGLVPDVKQNLQQSSFCLQRNESDSKIDWNRPCIEILRIIRASSRPYFGAFSFLGEKKIRIFRAESANLKVAGRAGQIFKLGKDMPFHVMCADGCLALMDVEVQDVPDWQAYFNRNINATLA